MYGYVDFILSYITCMTARRELGFILQLRMTAHCRLTTDLGCMTEQVYHNLAGSDFVVLESNHMMSVCENR